MLEVFSKASNSGFSAELTLELFNRLVKWKALTPLTTDPSEWVDISEMNGKKLYQSNREYSCFSEDLETYYDVDNMGDNGERIYKQLVKFGE